MNTVLNNLPTRPESAFVSSIEDVLAPDFFSALHVDVFRRDDEYVMEVAVPGMSRNDVKLSIESDHLIIEAERKSTRKTSDETQLHARHFRRSFFLPSDVDINRVTARCINGLLTVTLKRKPSGGRQITITSETEKTATKPGTLWHRLQKLFRLNQA